MKYSLFTKKNHFSIRKLSVGVCSVIIGASLFGGLTAHANDAGSTSPDQPAVGLGEQGQAGSGEVAASEVVTASTSEQELPAPAISNSPRQGSPASSEEGQEVPEQTTPVVMDANTYTLTYTTPSATTYQGWEREALPIGNGEMGAKIFGLIGEEKIQFNEKSLWSGGPTPDSTTYNGGNLQDKHAVLPQIREALERGDRATAKRLAEQHLVGPNNAQYGRYLSFGDIFIDFVNQSKDATSTTDYRRDLDITTAVSSTSYTQDGTSFKREHFSSFPDDVTVTRLTKTGEKALDFDLSMRLTTDLHNGHHANPVYVAQKSTYKTATVSYENNGVLLSGRVNDNQMNFASFLGIDTDGVVTRHDDKLSVRGATYATLLMNAKTDFAQDPKTNYRRRGANVVEEVKATVTAAKSKTYDQLKADHIADYKSLFDRVKINLGDNETATPTNQLLSGYRPENGQQLEEMFFQYGRYLMITSSRNKTNALPANLQGVWNAVDNPAWNSDYHLNVNLQMNYWPVYSTNIAETAIPLINYIDDMRHYGRIAAEEYGNIVSRDGEENGWLAHTQATPFGWTTPGWSYYWGWSPASNAWIMQNVYDHYKFTQDKAYLESKIYPMLKETAKFWNSFLHYDQASDRYVSSPSYSPEHGTITIGNTFDQSLVWQLFHDYMEAAKILDKDAEFVAEVKAKFDKLKPLHINQAGRIKEWFEEDDPNFRNEGVELHHRHVSELVGLFPGTLFSKDTPEYLEAARATLNHRGDGGTGWSKANKINLWARLLDGNRAHRLLAEQLRSSTLTNLWDTHSPFQIDGNFGATSGITEMLLQSHTGYIAPLAALPDAWKTGQVSGLVARGNVEVDMAWQDKNLTSMKLQAKSGGALQIDYPRIETATLTINGKVANFRRVQADRIEIQTNPGDVILLTDVLGRITDVRAERTGETNSRVTYSPVADAAYYRIERVGRDTAGQVTETRTFTTTETTYLDTVILPSQRYDYRVQAVFANQVTTAPSDSASIAELKLIMDDRDSSIRYGSAFRDYGDRSLYGGTEKYADLGNGRVPDEDATATVPFIGTGIQIYGLKHGGLGKAHVTIDGRDLGEIDFYATGATQKGVLIKEFTGLTDEPHVLTIRVKQEQPTRSGERNKISLDYFRVLSTVPSATEELDDRDPRVRYGSAYGNWDDPALYGGTEKFIDVTGSNRSEADRTATLTFNGTGIQIYGLKHSGLGKATVTIDGQPVDPLIFNQSGAVEKGVLIGEYRNLTDGEHTIAITVAPEAVNNSRHKISLDKFVILKAPVVYNQTYPATLADADARATSVALTLPEGDWTKVEVTLPEQTSPIVVTKAGNDVTVTGGQRVDNSQAGQISLALPDGQTAGLVRAVTYKEADAVGTSVANLARPTFVDKEVTTDLDFTTSTRNDNTRDPGRYVDVEGKKGSLTKLVREVIIDGEVVETIIINPELRRVEPINEVISIGTKQTETREREAFEDIEFGTENRTDPNLEKGQTREEPGQKGRKRLVYEDTYVNGELVTEGTEPILEEVVTQPQPKIIYTGTKEPDQNPTDPTDSTDPTTPVDPTDSTDPTSPVDPTDSTDPTTPVDPTDSSDPTTPVDPTNPTDPTTPVDPTNPTDPTSPVDPTDSSDPTTPVDPTDSSDPTTPVDPTDSSDPTTPVDPTDSSDPTTPVDPTDSSDPTTPVDPTDSSDPTTPVDPTDSSDPTSPVDPTDSSDPTTPVDPTDSSDPTTPVDPTNSTDPTSPVDPTDSSDPTTPVDPTDSTDPTSPVDPTDSSDPTTPVDPTDSTDPTSPVDPTDSTDPTTPVDPTKPADPVAPTQPAVTPARVLKDEATGVQVALAAGEDANIVALRIVPKETGHVATPSALKDVDYDLFDIELIDKDGKILKMAGRAEVSLPVDAGKEVAAVVYLPHSDKADSLPFRSGEIIDATGQRQKVVIFTAEHFSEYGIVYKPATVVPAPGSSAGVTTSQPAAPTAQAPAGSATATSKPTLPNTGEASSSLALLGGAALVAALGLTSLRKRED